MKRQAVAKRDAEKKAIAAIMAFGGKIERDDKKPGRPIVQLRLGGTQVTDTELKDLAGLKQLQRLDLSYTRVTGPGLKNLTTLNQLQELYLIGTQVTDAELKNLAALKQLRFLNLSPSKVTAAGLKTLEKALPGCQIR
jgi:hypothetical protein